MDAKLNVNRFACEPRHVLPVISPVGPHVPSRRNPAGLMIAEVVNWTGKVLGAPRRRLADLIERREAARLASNF
jgi:hypothetical protein